MNEKISYETWMQLGYSEEEAKELESLSVCPMSDENVEKSISSIEKARETSNWYLWGC